jgi:hypothetical protein
VLLRAKNGVGNLQGGVVASRSGGVAQKALIHLGDGSGLVWSSKGSSGKLFYRGNSPA